MTAPAFRRFAADLKRIRERFQWTQQQLGAALGVTWITIWRWEGLKHEPRLTLEQIEKFEKLKQKAEVEE